MISRTKRTPWRHKNNWCFTYFFSMTCFSLLMSPKRRSKLSQRSRVSLNLAFMLFIWKIYVHRTIGIRRRQRENTINVCTECCVAPPRPSPSPGGRSCSPSKSSGTPADSSAGTSTAEEQNPSEHFCVYQADKTASRRRLPLVEVRRSSRRGRCRPHTRTAPSSRPSYWPPADERSYLQTQTSTQTSRLEKHEKHRHLVWWSDTDQRDCDWCESRCLISIALYELFLCVVIRATQFVLNDLLRLKKKLIIVIKKT